MMPNSHCSFTFHTKFWYRAHTKTLNRDDITVAIRIECTWTHQCDAMRYASHANASILFAFMHNSHWIFHLENCNRSVCLAESNLRMQLPYIIDCRSIPNGIRHRQMTQSKRFYVNKYKHKHTHSMAHLNWFQWPQVENAISIFYKVMSGVFLLFRIEFSQIKKAQ